MAKTKTAPVETLDAAPEPLVDMTPASLIGGAITDQAAFLTTITAILNGSMAISINGAVVQGVSTTFSGLNTMPLVAAAIAGMLGGATVVRCTWNATTAGLTITTVRTGLTASIGYAGAPVAGTDISSLCHFTAATGASLTQGQVPRPAGIGVLRVQKQRYRDWIAAGGTPSIYT